jgi:hypothetical protein
MYKCTKDRFRIESQIHSLRVGWNILFSFPVVLLCQFYVLAGNRLWFYILLMYLGIRSIKLWCCVVFFGSGGKLFLVFHTYGTYCIIQFCGCVGVRFWQEIGFGFTYLCTESTIIHTIVVLC